MTHDSYGSAAPNWSGYRFAFDNPANVTDPTGNYEITDHYRVMGEEKTGEQIEPQKAGDDPIDVLYTDGYGLYSSRGATGALLLSGVYHNYKIGSTPRCSNLARSALVRIGFEKKIKIECQYSDLSKSRLDPLDGFVYSNKENG